jgi:hypothetical protein
MIVVSGSPRSGTSLLMQLLDAAHIPIANDNERKPDKHNPKGYFEVQDIITKIENNPSYLNQFQDKAIKIINYGLQYIEQDNVKYLYIERNWKEIFCSMEQMSDPLSDKEKQALKQTDREARAYIEHNEVLWLRHSDFFNYPDKAIDAIIAFLSIDPKYKQTMLAVIDHALYRNQSDDEDHSRPVKDDDVLKERLQSLG